MSESEASSESVFRKVGKTDEIPEGSGRAYWIEGRPIAVFRCDGRFYALDDFCPHQGAPLHDGFVTVSEKTVDCRHHGWRFSLETGCWLSSKRNGVETYPVRIMGDEIQIAVPSQGQGAG